MSSQLRKIIVNATSEMLDHPNEHGIYPTTKFYDRLEADIEAHIKGRKPGPTTLLDKATSGQKESIVELVSELEEDDVANSIHNATRCLKEHGHVELEVMVHNYYWRAGINHIKNEIRGILGLPPMLSEIERRRLEWDLKHPAGSGMDWSCPELQPHEAEITEGNAKLIPLGDDLTTLAVIGTKDRKKAARMMRRYQRDYYDNDLLTQDSELELKKMVWRDAKYEGEDDHTHMFSWDERHTRNNPKAVDAFIFEG